MASMFFGGKGVPQNVMKAYAWASIAAASGTKNATKGWAASRGFRGSARDIDSIEKFRNRIVFDNRFMTRAQAVNAQKLADELWEQIEAHRRLENSIDLARAFPNSVVGVPRVVDGDTIDIDGIRVRLQGVDAPEFGQTCQDSTGVEYHCGRVAAVALESRFGDDVARCEVESERDRYGRQIGVCFTSDGAEVNEWLVRSGWGVAYRKYSTKYVAAEEVAKAERLGIHNGRFANPWDWRQNNRQ